MYITIRIIITLVLAVVTAILILKSRLIKKKVILILSLSVIVIFASISYLIPAENLFFGFSTPEDAFHYSGNGNINKIIYGESSAFIIYNANNTNNAKSIAIIPKTKNGWGVCTILSYSEELTKTIDNRIINVYKAKNTDDYYVTVWEPFSTTEVTIKDNMDSVFQSIIEVDNATKTKNIIYCTCVIGLDSQYYLEIEGQTIYLTDR